VQEGLGFEFRLTNTLRFVLGVYLYGEANFRFSRNDNPSRVEKNVELRKFFILTLLQSPYLAVNGSHSNKRFSLERQFLGFVALAVDSYRGNLNCSLTDSLRK